VILEEEQAVNEIIGEQSKEGDGMRKNSKEGSSDKKNYKTMLNPKDKTQVQKVNGHELKFTNLDKLFWPDERSPSAI
jgi:bifunctional non-homologous end joining protein LigD